MGQNVQARLIVANGAERAGEVDCSKWGRTCSRGFIEADGAERTGS